MLKYSLVTLLVAVFVIALFCAAITNATEPWRQGAQWVLCLFLLTVLTAAIACRDRERAIAAGMAVFGWGCFYLFEATHQRPDFVQIGIDGLFVAVHGPPPRAVDVGDGHPSPTIQDFMRASGVLHDASYELWKSYEARKICFTGIAYAGVIALLSLLGGGLGAFFHNRSGRSGANKTSVESCQRKRSSRSLTLT